MTRRERQAGKDRVASVSHQYETYVFLICLSLELLPAVNSEIRKKRKMQNREHFELMAKRHLGPVVSLQNFTCQIVEAIKTALLTIWPCNH